MNATSVVVLTGAGISAESGVPTFRDAQTGLWAKFDPMELATPEAFAANPALVWQWYAWRRSLVAKAQPNAGHLALVELERRVARFSLFTQNVDDLHRRAGSKQLHELHGNIFRCKCALDGELIEESVWQTATDAPPKCPRCPGLARPDVVWFGESLDPTLLGAADRAARACDVFVSIGTSAEVYPAALLPQTAKRAGARLIEINPMATPLTRLCDQVIAEGAGTGMAKLLNMLCPSVG